MLKRFVLPLACVTLGTFGIAYAQSVSSPRDPYTQGADTGQGARTDKFDPYTQGADKPTKQEFAPNVSAPRDPYSQGADTGAKAPYGEGAKTINRDYPFDPSTGVMDRRNPYFQGG